MYAPWPSPGKFPFASVGVGAALGAVEHFAETAGSSTRVASALGGTVKLVEQEYVATEFAEASGEADMARLMVEAGSARFSELAHQRQTPTQQDLGRGLRDNALVTRMALRSVSRIFSLVGAKAGFPDHPVSRAKRDVEMVSHHVTLNWRQNAMTYMASRV
jgi:alkylation response protein AidB-like acyl-CoA dehydrogenase